MPRPKDGKPGNLIHFCKKWKLKSKKGGGEELLKKECSHFTSLKLLCWQNQ